ncbi:MAG: DUF2007 domain-containing protein [Thermodesulfobacteriota bacterium]
MKKLYIPANESELVFLKSVLEADGVPFYVLNDNFGSLYSGAYMSFFNAKTVMVPEDYYDDAKEIISSVIKDAEFVENREEEALGLWDIIERLISFFTLGLYSPSNEKSKKSDSSDN